jgi:transposase InsO family protein
MTKKRKAGPGGREVAEAYKLLVVQERMRGTPEKEVAAAFGVSMAAVQKWTTAFRRHGPAALGSKRGGRGGKTGLRPLKRTVVEQQVVALKREHETWGTRRIRDVLARFASLGVSEQQVRRILHQEGLIQSPPPAKEREHAPRRFERAVPNQLWQSDIFTFRLRRAERLYVCVFMDDHSRFIVGHSLAHHQKSALVMEAFERGVAAHGAPAEVLTDNGRQYTVWRGKTEFEEQLARMGILHIRSRPQHPQTLGKVERFWKTLWDEFLGRTVFAHVVDAQRRLEHFISHYNFQRPHQALEGLVPADRFFRAAAHVRAEVERAVQANELRLALEQPPRKPFYVVGQLGDQRLSIAAGATGLEVMVGNKSETIPLQEDSDGTRTTRRFTEEAPESTDPEMADAEDRPGRGRAQPRDAGPVGALGRETGDDGHRGGVDLEGVLLSTRDQGAERDALGVGAWSRRRFESGRDGFARADHGARSAGGEGGGGATARGAAVVPATQADESWNGEDAPGTPRDEDNALDAGWAEKLALFDGDELDEEAAVLEEERDDGSEPGDHFDPNTDWRDRGPERWERKLAGEHAAGDNLNDDQGATSELHAGTGATERSGPAPTIWRDRGGVGPATDRGGSGTHAEPVAQPLPDDLAPDDRGDGGSDHAEASGAPGEAGARSGAGGGEPTAAVAAGSDAESGGDDREDDGSGERDRFWEDAFAAISAALEEQEADVRRPRTSTDAVARGDDDA